MNLEKHSPQSPQRNAEEKQRVNDSDSFTKAVKRYFLHQKLFSLRNSASLRFNCRFYIDHFPRMSCGTKASVVTVVLLPALSVTTAVMV